MPAGGAAPAFVQGPRWVTQAVEAVFAPVAVPAEALPAVEVTVANDGRRATGRVNGSELWSIRLPRRRWLDTLAGQIVATMTMLLRRLVFVHAGAVEIDGRAHVFVGDSGAGKTSTVAALLSGGGAYLSDEVALLDPEAGTVWPFHLPMAIKPWTARAAGPLPAGTDVAEQDGVLFRLPARLGRVCPLGTIILLERGGTPALIEVSRARALLRLARQPSTFRYAAQTDHAFRAWARALRGVPCWELTARRPAALARTLLGPARRSGPPGAVRV